jgi:hypothetical protein
MDESHHRNENEFSAIPLLTSNNYYYWSRNVRNALKAKRLWRVVMGEDLEKQIALEKDDEETTEESKKDFKKVVMTKTEKAFTFIYMRCSHDSQNVITHLEEEPLAARKAWNALKDTYHASDKARLALLRQQCCDLHQMRMSALNQGFNRRDEDKTDVLEESLRLSFLNSPFIRKCTK